MAREATLFEEANGSVVEGYHLVRARNINIPPNWIDRATSSRKRREKALGKVLHEGSLDAIPILKEWETAYRKECFYYGLRALLELQRGEKTDL